MAEAVYANTKYFDQDKNVQEVFLENPELPELTMWTSFEKVVSPFIELLLHETINMPIETRISRRSK